MFVIQILARNIGPCTIALLLATAAMAQIELPSPSESIGMGESSLDQDATFSEADNLADSEEIQKIEAMPEALSNTTNWLNPTRWFIGPTWERRIELGLNGSEGNAEALSLLAAGRLKRETDRSTWGIDATYAKTESNRVLTQEYAFLNSRFDYNLGEGRWSLFNITRLEYDKFKAFDLRLAINGGIGYDLIYTDTRKLTGRFGAGASREIGSVNDQWVPEAVFGADYNHQLSDRQRLTITTDYYPSWDDFADYRLVTQASWEILLDEATNLSLKIGFLDRYDSTPFGLRPNDVDYFITLLWKH